MQRLDREIISLRNEKAKARARIYSIEVRLKEAQLEMAYSAYGKPDDLISFKGMNGSIYQGKIHSFAESFFDTCPIALVTVKSTFKPDDSGFLVMNVSDPSLVIRG